MWPCENKDRGEARRNGGANREGKPGTIRNADQIAFLDDGKLKEIGTHNELMSKAGDYAKFVDAELGDAHG